MDVNRVRDGSIGAASLVLVNERGVFAVVPIQAIRSRSPAPLAAAMDLSHIELSAEDLAGAIWSVNTKWPSQEISSYARDASDEISAGVYRVRTETEQNVTAD